MASNSKKKAPTASCDGHESHGREGTFMKRRGRTFTLHVLQVVLVLRGIETVAKLPHATRRRSRDHEDGATAT